MARLSDTELAAKLLSVYRKSEALHAQDSAVPHPAHAVNASIRALRGSPAFAHDAAPKGDKAARDAQRRAFKRARDEARALEDAEDVNEDPEGVDEPEGTPSGSASQFVKQNALNASRGSTVERDCNATDSALAFDYQGHADRLANKLARIRRESAWDMPSRLWQAQVDSDAQLPKQAGVSMDSAIPNYSRLGRQNGGAGCIKTRMG